MEQGETWGNRANALEQEVINLRAQHTADVPALQRGVNGQAEIQERMAEGLSAQMAIIMQILASLQPTLDTTTSLHCQCKFLQSRKSPRTLIEYNDGHKKDGSKMQENKAGKRKESRGKENHQGRKIREMETKIPLPPQKATTLIPVMMDKTMAVGEVEELTHAGDLTGVTIATDRSP